MTEREFQRHDSLKKIIYCIESLGLRYAIHQQDPLGLVASATLVDINDNIVSSGAGKGEDCEVGALAESLEHYIMLNSTDEQIDLATCNDILMQGHIVADEIIGNLPATELRIPCIKLEGLHSNTSVYVPAAIVSTNEDSLQKTLDCPFTGFLARYSTNSGTAFGCSFNEAILHGLNEVIERHMLSVLYMQLCNQHVPVLIHKPSPSLMKAVLREIPTAAPHVKSMRVLLSKTTAGVFFSVATPIKSNSKFILHPIGSGCSVSAVIAVKRSITELLQAMALYDESEAESDGLAYDLLDANPTFRSLISLNAIRTDSLPCLRLSPDIALCVEEQIKLITTRLKHTGYRQFYRVLKQFSNGCFVTQVYIPGMERFNIIRAGSPVAPQHILRSSRTPACSRQGHQDE
ncbi:YcaO-like family protein [Pseudomonas sp. R5(2019)]|uniref:YcaO-like family protein n=1 Tax=Pseudomonas sp. R5(2019) TaxID=2697566 RepID=UPI0014127964|nr:YcaO-like family protein [Pseudomonas sp. R5(2019)]NBA97709.1 hypothetical protein [Pseudomonas sp. R5(2019)]